jgi:hypothetical protein
MTLAILRTRSWVAQRPGPADHGVAVMSGRLGTAPFGEGLSASARSPRFGASLGPRAPSDSREPPANLPRTSHWLPPTKSGPPPARNLSRSSTSRLFVRVRTRRTRGEERSGGDDDRMTTRKRVNGEGWRGVDVRVPILLAADLSQASPRHRAPYPGRYPARYPARSRSSQASDDETRGRRS